MDKLPPRVFILDNKDDLNIALCNMMERKWLYVTKYTDYQKALDYLNNNLVHLIILSSRMWNISPIEMMIRIRKTKYIENVPIIFLVDDTESKSNYNSVKDHLISVVYRTIDPSLFISHVKKMIERAGVKLVDSKITYKNITINLCNYRVFVDDVVVHFSKLEFEIIKLLISNPGVIYTKEKILKNICKNMYDSISLKAINVHVGKIRKLITTELSKDKSCIYTVRSKGYYLA